MRILLKRFITGAATSILALSTVIPVSLQAAPPTVEEYTYPRIVRSKGDVQSLEDPTEVRAIGLDKDTLRLLLDHDTLTYVSIESGDVSDAGLWKQLAGLSQLRSLRITDLEEDETVGWVEFIGELKSSTIAHIALHRVYYVTQEWLYQFAEMPSLTKLELPGVVNATKQAPPDSPKWQLETLKLRGDCEALGLDHAWLGSIGQMSTLTSLSLNRVKFDSAGCAGLAASRHIRNLELKLCDWPDNEVPETLSFSGGLDRLCVVLHLSDEQTAKLITLNRPKQFIMSTHVSMTGRFLKLVDDWKFLSGLTIYAQTADNWDNRFIIDAAKEFPEIEQLRLSGDTLVTNEVVAAVLSCRPKVLVLSYAGAISTGTLDRIIEAKHVVSLIIRDLQCIPEEAAKEYRSKFLELREGISDARIELHVKKNY